MFNLILSIRFIGLCLALDFVFVLCMGVCFAIRVMLMPSLVFLTFFGVIFVKNSLGI